MRYALPFDVLVQPVQGAGQTAAELGQQRELSIAEKSRPGRSLLQRFFWSQCPQSDSCQPVVTTFLTNEQIARSGADSHGGPGHIEGRSFV